MNRSRGRESAPNISRVRGLTSAATGSQSG